MTYFDVVLIAKESLSNRCVLTEWPYSIWFTTLGVVLTSIE